MDLFEYQGKQYFARFDIPVSRGGAATTVDEAESEMVEPDNTSLFLSGNVLDKNVEVLT